MKAFVVAMVVLVAVALLAGFAFKGVVGQSAEQRYTTDNVRIN